MRRIGRPSRRLTAAFMLALLLAAIGLLVYVGAPAGELMPEAIAALASDSTVNVTRDRWIACQPADRAATAGFVFYPGGRIQAEAYAPLCRALAENGHLSVIVPMPLNLAVLNPDAANDVIAAYPSIQNWIIGGHSLGGVMAARYAKENEARVTGLVMLAAYPEAHVDLSNSDLTVATIYADRDGLTTVEEVRASFAQLPPDALNVLISGGNHAQFGWYGAQAGDTIAGISRPEQQAQVLAAILNVMHDAGKSI